MLIGKWLTLEQLANLQNSDDARNFFNDFNEEMKRRFFKLKEEFINKRQKPLTFKSLTKRVCRFWKKNYV